MIAYNKYLCLPIDLTGLGHIFLFLGLRIYLFEKRVGRSEYKNKYNWKYLGVARSKHKFFRVLR